MIRHGDSLIITIRQHAQREVVWTPQSCEQILHYYQQYRNDAKVLMKDDDPQRTFSRIDRHKIGAAFLMAILQVKPLRFTSPDAPRLAVEKYLNPILAFKTAVSILGIFLQHNQVPLPQATFPAARGAHYLEHAYRALAHASGGDRQELNLPLLAHWMFYIEQYWLSNGSSVMAAPAAAI